MLAGSDEWQRHVDRFLPRGLIAVVGADQRSVEIYGRRFHRPNRHDRRCDRLIDVEPASKSLRGDTRLLDAKIKRRVGTDPGRAVFTDEQRYGGIGPRAKPPYG